ncbi:MAG: tRNA pseudouridine(55) synthase TruB [Rhodocyclaceae bacterium]|nr:tRNA pseudouridine(55) synthase TruB [Rhodocyclaceae bacterium]
MSQRRRSRRAVDGVLLLDKPSGLSSNQALQQARRLFDAAKAGHTGTLDPLASGLLPLTFGEATKFAQQLLDADKTYLARVHLGTTTTTGDAEGDTLRVRPVDVDRTTIDDALVHFCGEIEQVPPMYSALKHQGRPLYELAREGRQIARPPRRVTIHWLSLQAVELPCFDIEVRCSKGTYVRTLAEDIGEALGCGAHLSALRRTAIGPLTVDRAVTLAQLEAAGSGQRDAFLAATDSLLSELPEIRLDAVDSGIVRHGGSLARNLSPGALFRLVAPDGFIGLGRADDAGRLWPKRLVAIGGDQDSRCND